VTPLEIRKPAKGVPPGNVPHGTPFLAFLGCNSV
jgi:hypothetical protein